ncbi:MAG TPA: cytochrome c oxidase assembly protein [Rhizomicrobium sp.]|nr:cytochrome c oxidase assembly protein [Rhizomicrobium sp.]
MTALAATADDAKPRNTWLGYGAILLVGGALDIMTTNYPADLPVWMPWDFSWLVWLVTALSLAWYVRGLLRASREERPPVWRRIFFVGGVIASYAVVQTRFDYLSQHMFFIHRFQHLVLHHLGPMLIALGNPGAAIWRGMPDFLKPPLKSRPVQGFVDFIQNPVVAPTLFAGLIWFWLIPQMHERVMLSTPLYNLMNWTMAVDGIFFWTLILDPRPKPPARLGFGWRALLVAAVVPPQLLVGAILSLSSRDYYEVYKICGRIIDISAISDQHFGGLILWIPSSMMSVIGLILVLNNMRLSEERNEHAQDPS